jgi:ubiquinone/menaquinone biosynthesis C-methylase UbiE
LSHPSSFEIKLRTTVTEDYESFYSGPSPWRDLGAKYKAKNLVEVCNRAGFKPERILEVGAGEGSILSHLDRMGFGREYHALEISNSGVRAIQERGIASLKDARPFNGYEIPYADDSFDAVVLFHVLEHVEYERALLREVRRVAPRHIIEVPLDYHFGVDEKMEHYLGYGHINVYTPSSVRFLLKSEGFRVDQELLTQTSEEVWEYIEFVNNKKERTPGAVANLHKQLSEKALTFYTAPKERAEQLANALTMLTSRAATGLSIFTNAKSAP